MAEVDHDHWLDGIARGDADAFASWLAAVERPLRVSLRSFAAHVDCESIVQETLLRCWRLAGSHRRDGKPNGLLRLALRIARNLAIDETRRRRPLEPLAHDAPLEANAPGADPLLREAIRGCLEALAGKPREALHARLAAGGGSTDATLALGLGVQVNTFLQNVVRARKQVVECLRKRGVSIAETRA